MRKRKLEIETAIDQITRRLLYGYLTPEERQFLDNLRDTLMAGKVEFDELLWDAELCGFRNPSFPGDLIGWLDDDFDLGIYGIEEDNDED